MRLTVDPVMTATFRSAGASEPILMEYRIRPVILWLWANEICITTYAPSRSENTHHHQFVNVEHLYMLLSTGAGVGDVSSIFVISGLRALWSKTSFVTPQITIAYVYRVSSSYRRR